MHSTLHATTHKTERPRVPSAAPLCAEPTCGPHPQDQPPSACSQLLTSAAFRQLNVECLNRLAVNTFVDKQAEASPRDMAGLMAALALVRCCSGGSSNQVWRQQAERRAHE